ncbi:MAG: hypothetical protein DRO14_00435, partial [Thermoprotei archaeon]
MTAEYRIFGPPGTGKTTELTRWAVRAADVFGEDQVSVCSLTRAAVREAAGRDDGSGTDLVTLLGKDNVTTLHARCKRALGAGPPAETKIEEFLDVPRFAARWSDEVPRLRRVSDDDEDEQAPETRMSRGSLAFERMVEYRQRMWPVSRWDEQAREIYRDWKAWCEDAGYMDYTMWLEACRGGGVLPAQQVVLVDEAQDHTPLQLDVLRAWRTRFLALFGDDDQSLYEWSGAEPRAFFDPPLPGDRERVLAQSYRVPREIHRFAELISHKIRSRREKV